MGFKNFLRDYFTFNRRERNGVFILLSIILILVLYLSFSDYFFSKEKIDFSKFEKEIIQFEAEQKRINDSVSQIPQKYFIGSNKPEQDNIERFNFNPNNLPEEDWKHLGLSERQIRVIKNYEAKGGKFRKKEDVKKMYCIAPELYFSLEPYIQIPENEKPAFEKYQLSTINHQPLLVELNSADTVELKTLKGIGSAFSKRIIKFRDALGGFVKKEQLLEVYEFDKEKYDEISENVFVDVSLIKKTNINIVTVDELKKHPYIKYNLANFIVNYRKQHGNYKTVDGLKKLDLVNDSIFTKLVPYLTTE